MSYNNRRMIVTVGPSFGASGNNTQHNQTSSAFIDYISTIQAEDVVIVGNWFSSATRANLATMISAYNSMLVLTRSMHVYILLDKTARSKAHNIYDLYSNFSNLTIIDKPQLVNGVYLVPTDRAAEEVSENAVYGSPSSIRHCGKSEAITLPFAVSHDSKSNGFMIFDNQMFVHSAWPSAPRFITLPLSELCIAYHQYKNYHIKCVCDIDGDVTTILNMCSEINAVGGFSSFTHILPAPTASPIIASECTSIEALINQIKTPGIDNQLLLTILRSIQQ